MASCCCPPGGWWWCKLLLAISRAAAKLCCFPACDQWKGRERAPCLCRTARTEAVRCIKSQSLANFSSGFILLSEHLRSKLDCFDRSSNRSPKFTGFLISVSYVTDIKDWLLLSTESHWVFRVEASILLPACYTHIVCPNVPVLTVG